MCLSCLFSHHVRLTVMFTFAYRSKERQTRLFIALPNCLSLFCRPRLFSHSLCSSRLRAEQEEWTAPDVHAPDGGSVRLRPQGELAKRRCRGNEEIFSMPSQNKFSFSLLDTSLSFMSSLANTASLRTFCF